MVIGAHGKKHAMAVGQVLMGRDDVREVNKGHCVENLHFLGDGSGRRSGSTNVSSFLAVSRYGVTSQVPAARLPRRASIGRRRAPEDTAHLSVEVDRQMVARVQGDLRRRLCRVDRRRNIDIHHVNAAVALLDLAALVDAPPQQRAQQDLVEPPVADDGHMRMERSVFLAEQTKPGQSLPSS